MHKHYSIDYTLNIEFDIINNLINKAYEKDQDERLYSLYVNFYPFMKEKEKVSYDKFKKTYLKTKSDIKAKTTEEDIIADVERTLKIKK